MAERLKDLYGPDMPARIGAMIARVEPRFPVEAFLAEALDGFEDLDSRRGPGTSPTRSLPSCPPTTNAPSTS